VVNWLHDNAPKYGLSFPLANENWHIEPAEVRQHKPLVSLSGLAPIPEEAPVPMARRSRDTLPPPSLTSDAPVPMPRSAADKARGVKPGADDPTSFGFIQTLKPLPPPGATVVGEDVTPPQPMDRINRFPSARPSPSRDDDPLVMSFNSWFGVKPPRLDDTVPVPADTPARKPAPGHGYNRLDAKADRMKGWDAYGADLIGDDTRPAWMQAADVPASLTSNVAPVAGPLYVTPPPAYGPARVIVRPMPPPLPLPNLDNGSMFAFPSAGNVNASAAAQMTPGGSLATGA
jgi:hypothetical protein